MRSVSPHSCNQKSPVSSVKKILWHVEDRRSDRVKETARSSVHDRFFRRVYHLGCFMTESYFSRYRSRRCLFPSCVPAWLYPLPHLDDQPARLLACLRRWEELPHEQRLAPEWDMQKRGRQIACSSRCISISHPFGKAIHQCPDDPKQKQDEQTCR
jgi:hypothetical protein